MSGFEVRAVDPAGPDFAPFHAAYDAALRHELGPAAAAWTAPELRVALREPDRRLRQVAYAGWRDGAVVATGWLGTPLLDNTDTAQLDVHVPPERRRRGHGSLMLAHLQEAARALGRHDLDAEVGWPHELGASGVGSPGVAFASARGYSLSLGDVQRELALPVDAALLEHLAARAARHHAAYTLRSWVGAVPDDLATGWMTLSASLTTEAPTGDRDREPEVVDVTALREREASTALQGRTRYHCVALDAAGEVVGYTDLITTVHEPDRAYQWGTLVRRDARGRRLGLALKVANLQSLQRHPVTAGLRRLTTWNAESNTAMIEINELLGFLPTARLGEFHRRLP